MGVVRNSLQGTNAQWKRLVHNNSPFYSVVDNRVGSHVKVQETIWLGKEHGLWQLRSQPDLVWDSASHLLNNYRNQKGWKISESLAYDSFQNYFPCVFLSISSIALSNKDRTPGRNPTSLAPRRVSEANCLQISSFSNKNVFCVFWLVY